jgi:hypothetical protein
LFYSQHCANQSLNLQATYLYFDELTQHFHFFVFVSGAQEVLAKIVAPPPLVTPKIEPASSDATSSSTSEQRRFLAADVYKTKDGKIFVNVSRKTMSIVGRKSEDLLKIMEGTTVEGLIESGELVRNYSKTRLIFFLH